MQKVRGIMVDESLRMRILHIQTKKGYTILDLRDKVLSIYSHHHKPKFTCLPIIMRLI